MAASAKTAKGSVAIDELYRDAENFLSASVVSALKMFDLEELVPTLPNVVQFKLDGTPERPKQYFLKFDSRYENDESKARNARPGYILGYTSTGQLSKTPAFVDIPKKPDQGPVGQRAYMLFTGMLSGCTLVVTSLNDTHYRVFHDSRVNSADLYDQFIVAMEDRDYGDSEGGSATVLMQFNKTTRAWSIHAQGLQIVQSDKSNTRYKRRKLPAGKSFVLTRTIDPTMPPRPWVAGERLKVANDRRQDFLRKLQAIPIAFRALEIEPPQSDEDGALEPATVKTIPGLESRAVCSTQAYSKYLKELANHLQQMKQGHDIPGFPKDSVALQEMIRSIWAVDRECCGLDREYLWLLIRRDAGEEAVLVTTDVLRVELQGSSTGEKFEELEVRLRVTPTDDVVEGYTKKDWATIAVRDIDTNASLLVLKRACVSMLHKLKDMELGSLLHRIETAAKDERLVWLDAGNRVIQDLRVEGASDNVRRMPLDVMRRLNGSTYSYVLVRVVAVALWTEGPPAVDQFMAKLNYLGTITADRSLEAALLLRALRELRSNTEVLQASKFLAQLPIDRVLNYLLIQPGNACKLLALNTETHSMLLGATIKKESVTAADYHFYDPNFAMVTYSSVEALREALERHLVQNGYAKTYDAFGQPDKPPEFCLYEIDGARLARLDIDSDLVVENLSSETTLTERIERGSGLPGPEAAARALAENLAFRSVVAAAGAQTVSNVNGPSIREFNGRRLIRVPADSLTGRIFGLQLDDSERPGFP